jgi:hypothetical protein
MSNQKITVECPTCGYKWPVNLADYQAERTLYRGETKAEKITEYRFKGPKDGTYFIVPVKEG